MENDKKNINELSEQELEEFAKTKVEIKEEDNYISDAHKFVMKFNVKVGTTRVPSFMIHQTYKKHMEASGLKPQHKNTFLRDFAKLFDSKKDPYYKYYLLDPTPFNLSEEAFQEHRREMTYEKKKRFENKKQANKYKEIVEKEKAEAQNRESQEEKKS